MHATNLQVHAGIMVTAGVSKLLSPKAPINAKTAYGVHDATNMKQTVIAAFAMRISTDCFCESVFDLKLSTFIFFACSFNAFSCATTCETI